MPLNPVKRQDPAHIMVPPSPLNPAEAPQEAPRLYQGNRSQHPPDQVAHRQTIKRRRQHRLVQVTTLIATATEALEDIQPLRNPPAHAKTDSLKDQRPFLTLTVPMPPNARVSIKHLPRFLLPLQVKLLRPLVAIVAVRAL